MEWNISKLEREVLQDGMDFELEVGISLYKRY
jgi:hypothetical protein